MEQRAVDTRGRAPRVAAMLSAIVPGWGQLYNGERAKGVVVLCMGVGIASGIWLSLAGPRALRSVVTAALLVLVYPFVWLPAVIDAWRGLDEHSSRALSGNRPWYTVLMLLAVGPMALPLLWHSHRFSRRAKSVWTVVVVAIALFALVFALWVGPVIEEQLREVLELLTGAS